MYKILAVLYVTAVVPAMCGTLRVKKHVALLSTIMNRTVCPMEVEFNTQETRIPKTIRYIKCAERDYDVCKGPYAEAFCCKSKCKYMPKCVQMEDFVLVGSVYDETLASVLIPVGCNLVNQKRVIAIEVL